jgi:citrate lyase subunit beta/citryl-CoA lyase
MNPGDLRLCRTILFLPASNARAIEKASGLDADMVILDLEDAVKEDDKAEAREMAIAATAEGFGERFSAIRMNAAGTGHYRADVEAVRRSAADFVILAKVETPGQAADAAAETGKHVLAMIETPRGVLGAAAIAPATHGLIAGTNDLSAELGIQPGGGRPGLVHALQQIVLAARAAGVAAFDGVHNGLDDEEGLAEECRQGRAFGFDGKSLIHPNQIAAANRLFGPGEEEIRAAERLIAAATGGAERFEGKMIEAMHVHQARSLLARARRG